jgi:hypothetical protein
MALRFRRSGGRPRNHSQSRKHTIAFRPTRSTDFLTGDRSDSGGGTRTDFGDMQLFDRNCLGTSGNGSQVRIGTDIRVPDRDLEVRWSGRVAGGSACAAVYTGVPSC